jgi:hypothetical protein
MRKLIVNVADNHFSALGVVGLLAGTVSGGQHHRDEGRIQKRFVGV